MGVGYDSREDRYMSLGLSSLVSCSCSCSYLFSIGTGKDHNIYHSQPFFYIPSITLIYIYTPCNCEYEKKKKKGS